MNIAVCVKPVPDPEKYNLLRIDPKTKRLVREGIPTIVNPSDKCALEVALQLKEKVGGEITVFSMCAPFAADRIKECLAMGADKAVMVSDMKFGGSDTLATSYILAKAIEKTGTKFDLVLTGNESADGATSQVSPQLGEWLEEAHISNVLAVEYCDECGKFTVKKKTADGSITYAVKAPVTLAIARGSLKPRMVSAMGIIKAKNKPFETYDRECFGSAIDDARIGLAGSPTKAGGLIEPNMARKAEKLEGDAKEIAAQIVEIVKKAGINM